VEPVIEEIKNKGIYAKADPDLKSVKLLKKNWSNIYCMSSEKRWAD